MKLDLKKLNGVRLVMAEGQKCVLIPTEANKSIYVGEKGIYLNLTATALKQEGQYGDTHFIKGNIDKEVYNSLSDEEKKALPIIGNMRPIGHRGKGGKPAAASSAGTPGIDVTDLSPIDGDLPF